jgi:hypothetical protein
MNGSCGSTIARVCTTTLPAWCLCLAKGDTLLFRLRLSLYLLSHSLSLSVLRTPSALSHPTLSGFQPFVRRLWPGAAASTRIPRRGASLRAVRCTRQTTLPASYVARFHLKGLDKASTLNLIPAHLGRSIRVTLDVFFNQKTSMSWKMPSQVRAELQATIEWPTSTSKASHAEARVAVWLAPR